MVYGTVKKEFAGKIIEDPVEENIVNILGTTFRQIKNISQAHNLNVLFNPNMVYDVFNDPKVPEGSDEHNACTYFEIEVDPISWHELVNLTKNGYSLKFPLTFKSQDTIKSRFSSLLHPSSKVSFNGDVKLGEEDGDKYLDFDMYLHGDVTKIPSLYEELGGAILSTKYWVPQGFGRE